MEDIPDQWDNEMLETGKELEKIVPTLSKQVLDIWPPDSFKQKAFMNLGEVRQAYDNYHHKCHIIRHFQKETIGICCKFKRCRAHAGFDYDQEKKVYRCVRFQNRHYHLPKINKAQQEKALLAQAQRIGQNNLSISKHYQHFRQKFGLPIGRFRYLLNKFQRREKRSHRDILKDLKVIYMEDMGKQEGYDLPEVLVFTDPFMQKLYTKFGDCIKFDVTYGVFRNRTFEGEQWGLGLFSGFNQNNTPIIFGISLACSKYTSSYEKIFTYFLRIINGKPPQTVITDQEPGIDQAFKRLQQKGIFNGHHLFDQWHFQRNCLRKISNAKQQESAKQCLKKILVSRNKKQIRQSLETLLKNGQQKIVQAYVTLRRRVSNFYAPQAFFGVSLTSSSAEALNALIKRRLSHAEVPLQRGLKIIMQINRQLASKAVTRSKDKMVQQHNDPHLMEVQSRLGQRIFLKFIVHYLAASRLKCTHQNNKFTFLDGFMVENGRCSCKYSSRSGLPCCHQIFVAQKVQLPLLGLIRDRWKIQERTPPASLANNQTSQLNPDKGAQQVKSESSEQIDLNFED